jgi:hypothetical protein
MSNYIHISLRTDEDNLMGSSGWGEYDAKDSIADFASAVEIAVSEAYPDAEVDVTTYAARHNVDSDVAGAELAVPEIIGHVWSTFDWLCK